MCVINTYIHHSHVHTYMCDCECENAKSVLSSAEHWAIKMYYKHYEINIS